MKILKARNGIALVAVLTIMLITSLFIPLMFNLSDTSLYIAVKGTDRQRASYLARTVTEMSVAAFKSFDSTEESELAGEEKTQYNKIKTEYDKLVNHTINAMYSQEVAMFSDPDGALGSAYYQVFKNGEQVTGKKAISFKEYQKLKNDIAQMEINGIIPDYTVEEVPNSVKKEAIVYANVGSTEYNNYIKENSGYVYLGKGQTEITYDNSIKYYETNLKTGLSTEIPTKTEYDTKVGQLNGALTNGADTGCSYSMVENKNVIFTTTATVNGITATRSCVVILQTYPSEEDWFTFGIAATDNTGGNQVFVDPTKATSVVPITYDQAIGSDYIRQNLLVYSSVGNMLIQPTKFKDPSGVPQTSGNKNSQFVLGVQPGLNTTPNNDPSYAVIDGVNYDDSTAVAQMNNFVAFASTSAIQVDMPVNLLVNPCRAKRAGDGYFLGYNPNPNGSLFKIMIFQAPIIQFNERLDMMMSFYQRDDEEARRMSSIILSAPDGTPYSYYNVQRGKSVKAGKVFFQEDCYLWIIPFDEDGSASAWTGFLSETIYYRDSDFQRIKIADAGDVYYFNAEVMGTKKYESGAQTEEEKKEKVGLSLTGYYLETEYIPKYDKYNQGEWWQLWNNTKAAIFGKYMQNEFSQNTTYVADDFKYIGNINEGDVIEIPEIDDYYTIWKN